MCVIMNGFCVCMNDLEYLLLVYTSACGEAALILNMAFSFTSCIIIMVAVSMLKVQNRL